MSCLRRVPFPCVARKGAPPVAESSDRGGWAGTWFCTNEVQGKTLVPTRRKEPKDAFFTSELHSVGAGNGAAEIQAVAPLPGLYQLRCVSPPRSHARIPRQLRPRRCIIRPCGGGRKPDGRHVCRPYRACPRGYISIIFRRKIPSLYIVHCQLSIAFLCIQDMVSSETAIPSFFCRPRDFSFPTMTWSKGTRPSDR